MPIDYAKVIQKIKNEVDLTNVDLSDVVQAHQGMVISIAATTTRGKPLPEPVLNQVCTSQISICLRNFGVRSLLFFHVFLDEGSGCL